jgi:hypothetical protein
MEALWLCSLSNPCPILHELHEEVNWPGTTEGWFISLLTSNIKRVGAIHENHEKG